MSATDTRTQNTKSAADTEPAGDILAPNQRQLGRYSLLRELRRDRSSVTLLALDPVMHREVVLKAVRLPPPIDGARGADAETHALEQAFVRQAQAAGRLHHPHIVTVFEAARVHHIGFLAIERVNGRPMHELLASGWRPDFVHCASLAARIADAIEYAHNQSVAHGHLGPQHVVVQPDGAPRIEGFGGWIDGGAGGDEALAYTEKLLPYFQNEVSEDARRRDVQAIVVLLHMLLTGKPPQMRTPAEGGAPRPVSVLTVRPDTPPQLARLIDEMLDPAGAGAFRTAGDLRDVLTAYIWNARKSHVAPATIGIPLAAPPEAPPELPPADLNLVVRPRSASRTVAPDAPATITRTIAGSPTRPTTRSHRTSTARPPAPAVNPITRAGLWLKSNRIAVAGAVGLVVVGLVVGTLLGRNSPIAQRVQTVAPTAVAPKASGIVSLDIQPWGEIFVDGKAIGVAPPMKELTLAAGRHNIEIRHGEKAAVTATVDVDPARPQLIQHRFE